MIRSKRHFHRRMFFVLTVLIPTILFVGLAFRPDVPPLAQPDNSLLAKAGFSLHVPTNLSQVQTKDHTFEVAVETTSASLPSLIIRSVEPLLKPDLLVYWVQGSVTQTPLPEQAVLLGALMGTSFRHMPLPQRINNEQSTLIIYSLGHQEVLTHFLLPSQMGKKEGAKVS